LAEPYVAPTDRRAIADAVFNLENTGTVDLMRLLAAVRVPHRTGEVDRV
jgi:hypothetical protein